MFLVDSLWALAYRMKEQTTCDPSASQPVLCWSWSWEFSSQTESPELCRFYLTQNLAAKQGRRKMSNRVHTDRVITNRPGTPQWDKDDFVCRHTKQSEGPRDPPHPWQKMPRNLSSFSERLRRLYLSAWCDQNVRSLLPPLSKKKSANCSHCQHLWFHAKGLVANVVLRILSLFTCRHFLICSWVHSTFLATGSWVKSQQWRRRRERCDSSQLHQGPGCHSLSCHPPCFSTCSKVTLVHTTHPIARWSEQKSHYQTRPCSSRLEVGGGGLSTTYDNNNDNGSVTPIGHTALPAAARSLKTPLIQIALLWERQQIQSLLYTGERNSVGFWSHIAYPDGLTKASSCALCLFTFRWPWTNLPDLSPASNSSECKYPT